MKESLLEILVCPVCKGRLELKGAESDGKEVTGGSLFCARCNHTYKIVEGIPNLLPPDMHN
jgi:uncharacterized protein YbaR (Trm112 family)